MYCFQCGEELVEGARFCHVCGANQEESRKLFEKKFKNSSPDYQNHNERDSGGDTKVAYSSDPDDGADLKSYLNKVDTHVSENLKKHETLSGLAKTSSERTREDDRHANPTDDDIKSEEVVPEQTERPKKKSFSDIWNSFIDEEDNPYSVFGDMADRLEHDQRAVASENEDMLRVSQDVEDERYAQTGDVGTINKKVNAILDEQEREADKKKLTPKKILSSFFSKDKDKDEEFDTASADDTLIPGKSAKNDTVILNPSDQVDATTFEKAEEDEIIPADSYAFDAVQSEDQDDTVISPADADSHNPSSFEKTEDDMLFAANRSRAENNFDRETVRDEKSATISPADDDAFVAASNSRVGEPLEADEEQDEESSSRGDLKNFFARFKSKKDSTSTEADDAFDREVTEEAVREPDVSKDDKKQNHARLEKAESFFKLEPASNRLQLARKRVLDKGQQGFRGLLGVGIVLSALPVFFAFRRIGILPIVFTILKVAIDLCAFYFANNVARKNTYIDDDERSRNIDNLLLWILYLIPTTIMFFILPSSFAMGRTVLGSVTPHILVSVVLYVWVLFLALSTVQNQLPKESRSEFLAWYGIIFISINLIAKLFWIIAIFLTSTFS